MKKLFSLIATFGLVMSMSAADVQLVVEAVDNGGLVPGNTYRVYAVLPDAQHSLHAVFADDQSDLLVETTGSFFQHPYGNYSTLDINPNIVQADPSLAFDSWVTIGAENNQNNNLWTVGVDYASFMDGGTLTITDGAWFLIPTDVRAMPDAGNMILLMQITTDGIASGSMNFQGWGPEGEVWQARGVTFSTSNTDVLGCMDATATNYNANATFDNGSCEFDNNGGIETANSLTNATDEAVITVFPNPVFEGQFNLQFSERLDLSDNNLIVDVFSMSGQKVISKVITAEAVIGGNRVIIDHDLAAGTYTVNVMIGEYNEATQVIVQR
jgi:hypothetical protein